MLELLKKYPRSSTAGAVLWAFYILDYIMQVFIRADWLHNTFGETVYQVGIYLLYMFSVNAQGAVILGLTLTAVTVLPCLYACNFNHNNEVWSTRAKAGLVFSWFPFALIFTAVKGLIRRQRQ